MLKSDFNMNNINAEESVRRMRAVNPQKLDALIKMHFFMESDMNINCLDQYEQDFEYAKKGKTKVWHLTNETPSAINLSKFWDKINQLPNGGTSTESKPIDEQTVRELQLLKDFLMNESSLKTKGIFQLSGSLLPQINIQSLLKLNITLVQSYSGEEQHVIDMACIYKRYLGNLNQPILIPDYYPAFKNCSDMAYHFFSKMDEEESSNVKKFEIRLLNCIRLLMLLLPHENIIVLKMTVELANGVIISQNENYQKKLEHASNLATIFAPHLVIQRNMPKEIWKNEIDNFNALLSFIFMMGMKIFEVPKKLTIDICAYFINTKNALLNAKQNPDSKLNMDNIFNVIKDPDTSVTNSCFSFVDVDKSANANSDGDLTKIELRKLYNHINSMPDGATKNQLLESFLKSHGTTLELLPPPKNLKKTKPVTESIEMEPMDIDDVEMLVTPCRETWV